MERKLDIDENLYESEELSLERYLKMNPARNIVRFGDDKTLIRLVDGYLIYGDYAEKISARKDDDINKEILEVLPPEIVSNFKRDSIRMSNMVLHPAPGTNGVPVREFLVLTGIPKTQSKHPIVDFWLQK